MRSRELGPDVGTSAWQRAAALLALALAIRLLALVVAIALGRFPEYWEPEVLARNVLAGHGYVYPALGTLYHAYMEPLYPGLVIGVYALTGGSAVALSVAQCLIGALLPLVIYAFTRRAFGEAAAVAAALIVAVHPALAGYTVKFHPLVLDSVLLPLVALTLLRLRQAPSATNTALFGVALGLCVLTRPTVLVFVAIASAWWFTSPAAQELRRPLGAGLVIAALIVTPWVVRNYLVLHTVVLTRANVGYVFWLGNHPGTSGGAADPTDPTSTRSMFDGAPVELRDRVLSTDEIGQHRIFLAEALAYVKRAPGAFVRRWGRKLGYFWGVPPYSGKRYPRWQIAVYHAFYVGLVIAALAGLWSAWRHPVPGQGPGLGLAVLLPAAVAVTQALFYVEGRHRLGVESMLAVPAGLALARLRERFRPGG
jgi:4-amino-4-deoxy-L-arabinose transferase-like glycosyltransferase